MKKAKGLYISYYYLPILVPRSIVSYKHLENSEFDFDVYAANTDRKENDKILEHNKKVKIIREGKINGVIDKFKYALNSKKYFKKNQEEYKFIMTSFMPLYSMLGGYFIKRKYKNIPWISYYSDPPATNFNPKISFAKKVYMWLEKKLVSRSFKYADILLFTNQEQLDYCLKGKNEKYKSKAKILHHSYCEELYPKDEIKNKKIIISHFGRLFGARNASQFIKAMALLKDKNQDIYNNIECRFYGNVSEDQENLINSNNLTNIRIMGFVNYIESLKAMRESDYLLCVDAFLPKGENVFYPSKLADYIGAKRNIIAIVPEDSTSARIIKELEFPILNNNDKEIYEFLKLINKKQDIKESKHLIYSAKVVSKELDEYIKSII